MIKMPTPQEVAEFAESVYVLSDKIGWFTPSIPALDDMQLMCITELSEALEDLRNRKPLDLVNVEGADGVIVFQNGSPMVLVDDHKRTDLVDYNPLVHGKPTGFLTEMADYVIRCLEAAACYASQGTDSNLPLEERLLMCVQAMEHYSRFMPDTRHTVENAHDFIKQECKTIFTKNGRQMAVSAYVTIFWAHHRYLPLWGVIQTKHSFNETREYRHGNKAF